MDDVTSGEIAEAVVRLLTYVIGTVGNLIVIFVILFLGEYKKITHWYVLQLALADLLFLQTVPFWVTQLLQKGWTFGSWFCTVCYTILYFNYFSSILFLMIMAIDRYLAVCHGQKKFVQNLRSNKKCNIITLGTWILCLLLCIPLMLFTQTTGIEPNCRCSLVFPVSPENWCEKYDRHNGNCLQTTFIERYQPPSCKPSEVSTQSEPEQPPVVENDTFVDEDYYEYDPDGDYYSGFGSGEYGPEEDGPKEHHCKHSSLQPGMTPFVLANFVGFFVVPLIVIAICYGLIVLQLRNKIPNDSGSTRDSKKGIFKSRKSSSISSTGRSQKDKKRITKLCVILVGVFVVCWLPYHAMVLAMIPGFTTSFENFCNTAFAIFLTLAYLNSALNPFMYNFLGSFKKRLRQIRSHERTRSFFSGTRLTKIIVSGRGTSQLSSEESKSRKQRNGSSTNAPSEDAPLRNKVEQTNTTTV